MSEAWIVVGLVVIAVLYALLFVTADSLHAAELRRRAAAPPTPRGESGPDPGAAPARD
jgi:hypothetical protein